MDPVAAAAQAILRNDPAPGLPLGRLTERLRSRLGDARLNRAEVRGRLEAEPARFRILDLAAGLLGDRPELGPRGAWVAVLTDPADGAASRPTTTPAADAPTGAARRLRDSVRWMAGRVDERSRRDVARWRRMLLSESGTRMALAEPGDRAA